MACTTNNTVKPDVMQRPNNLYGAPQGQSGRTFNSVNYGVQGIVLHCTDMTISQYIQYLACLTQPVNGANQETNHHYSIGSSGALNQHIDDGNISWTFGNYTAATYVTPPSPTTSVNWPTLQAVNGAEVSPDVYVINILIAKSYNQSTTCLTSSGLPSDQHEKLIQLLAYLSATYNIPLDADHINWHDNIATQACPSNECICDDIACLLTDINTYCEEDCNTVTYSEVDCDSVSHLLAIPNNCGNASGCLVSIPFDACCFGHLAEEGDIDIFLGLSSTSDDPCETDAEYCLVKNFINVTAPLTGQGTASDPLTLDLCAFGEFVPVGTPITLLGIDAEGCLVESDIESLVAANETPITVVDTNSVDLTASGTNNHTIQADVKVSGDAGNLLQVNTDGLFVEFGCENFKGLFEEDTLTYLYGVDDQGECAFENTKTLIDRIICSEPVSTGTYGPLHILGRSTNMDCPEFFTPLQVVEAGLTIQDTNSVDLDFTDGVLTANVIIDPDSTNTVSIQSGGVYVPELTVTSESDCLTATVVDNLLTLDIVINPDATNILSCTPTGLYVQDLVVVDTDCIDLTYNNNTRELSAEVSFSGTINDVPNVASCEDTGFYVPQGANLAILGPLVGSGADNDPLDIDFSLMDNQDLCDFGGVIPQTLSLVDVIGLDSNGCLRQYTGEQFIAQFLEINNGDCITATLTDNVLSIEPVISPAIGAFNNVLSCNPTGLYVPQGAGIIAQATNCVDIQLVNGVLTSTLILDPDALNQISCNVDGLYVEQGAGVTGGTTDCIQVVATNGEITATPIISPAILGVGNVLSCEPGGLFVPTGAGIVPVTTDCLTVTFDTSTGELTVEPIISPLVDNTLQCTANGLYVPESGVSTIADTDCMSLALVGGELTATPIIDPDADNLLECRATGLFANFTVLDTLCIDLTLENGTLSASPIVDPVATNLLVCGVSGLLVELDPDVFIDSDCINFDVTNGLVTATPILAPDQGPITNILRCIPGEGLYVPVGGGITTLNGSCVELELIAGVLTAEVIVDTITPDNAITCGPDGLYVPICCPLVVDTNTVNLTLTDPRTITADVIIDPDGTNTLVANPNGLYVPTPFITAAIDSNCIDVEVVGGILTINPVLSATVDNQIQCLADGFYVPDCCPVALDTDTVDLTITGTNTISADVNIDPDPTNALVSNANGLYVPEAFIQTVNNTQCMELDVTGGVLTATPVIDPAADNQLTCGVNGLYAPPINVVDTDCIDLDLTGGTLTATVIVNPAADNLITCVAGQGMYVPPLAGVDTNCIDVDITNNVLTINPILSATADNTLQCLGDGLYVPNCCPVVVDTTTVDLTLTGTNTISAEVIIDPDATNAIVSNPNGLYVPTPLITAVDDTNCIETSVVGGVLTVDPIIDPAIDNLLTCGPNGLYVEPMTAVDGNCIDLGIINNVLTAEVIISTQANNIVQCLGDGLFAEAPVIGVLATDCIDLTLNSGILEATPILDPDLTNQLTCGANGLFVPEPAVTAVNNTQCITLDLTAGVLTATPVIDPDVANSLECRVTGLFVQEITVDDTDSIDLTIVNGQITADLIVDPDPTNAIVVSATGVYVPEDFIQNVLDTNCIDIDVTNGVLSVNPVISPLADNRLTCQGDGLYVPGINVVDTNCIDLDFTADTLTVNPIISAQPNNIVQCLGDGFFAEAPVRTVSDTDCINLTLNNGDLTAEPIIDPALDNQLQCLATGLYVSEPFITSVIDTDCLDLDVTNGVLTATVIVDPAVDNQLTCGAGTGLYVPPVTVVDTNCIDLDITNNVLTANPIISATADNQLQCLGDGLYVPECCPLVTDTNSIDLTLTGTREISANLIVDPDPTNALVVNANGVYVPEDFIQAIADTQCMTLDVTNGVLTATPVIDPVADNLLTCGANGLLVEPMTVVDGNCIDLTITNNVLTAETIISAQANNIVQCLGDGLFAEAPVRTVADTDCISLVLNAGELTATPIIDPDLTNQLTCGANGLFVPEPVITAVADTNCIELTITGGVLTADPIVSATADNQITCIGDGLYVPIGAGITGDVTDCIDIDVTNGVVTATPIISPTIGGIANTLTCEATGLYVPELQIDDTDCIDLDFTGGVLTANPILAPDQGGVSNVLTCLVDGLYVPAGAGLTVLDGNCIDLTIVNGNVITADVIVDPTADNQLICNVAGLYVPPINVVDSNCIDLEIIGNALVANIIIAPAQGGFDNITECLADGLYTPETVLTRNVGAALSGGNTIDVDTDGDNVPDFTFCEGICEIVTSNDCITGIGDDYVLKQFEIVGDTLTVESAADHTSVSAHTRQGAVNGPGITGLEVAGTIVEQGRIQITITNPSVCREMSVTVTGSALLNMDFPFGNNGMGIGQFVAIDSSISGVNVSRAAAGHVNYASNQGFVYNDLPIVTFGDMLTLSWSEIIGPGATVTFDLYTSVNVRNNLTPAAINDETLTTLFEFDAFGVTI